jgi:hypothetical protein
MFTEVTKCCYYESLGDVFSDAPSVVDHQHEGPAFGSGSYLYSFGYQEVAAEVRGYAADETISGDIAKWSPPGEKECGETKHTMGSTTVQKPAWWNKNIFAGFNFQFTTWACACGAARQFTVIRSNSQALKSVPPSTR